MQQPIKVIGRFATVHDTAKTLGVSPARTRELIEAAKEFFPYRSSRSGSFVTHDRKTGSRAGAVKMKKSSGRHAETGKKKVQARTAKAHR